MAHRILSATIAALLFVGCAGLRQREEQCASADAQAAVAAALRVAARDIGRGDPWESVLLDVAVAAGPWEACAWRALFSE